MSGKETLVTVQESTPPDTIDLTDENFDDSVLFVSQSKPDNAVEFVSLSQVVAPNNNTTSKQHVTNNQLTITDDDDDDNLDLPSLDLDNKFKELAKKRTSLKVSRPPIFCGICREDEFYLQAHNQNLVSTPCGHIFCKCCIDVSLAKYKCCPICRKSLAAMAAEKSVVRIKEMEKQPSVKSLTHRPSILKDSALLRASRTKLTGSSRIFDDKPWQIKKTHQTLEEYEPTYKMKPDKLLNISAIEKVATDVLQKLKNDTYAVESCRQFSKTLSHLLLQKVKELGFPRYVRYQ
ncbi:E3 ubiquitin-protein ligase RNF4-like [Oopsacas minuta]|uniref:E3 ubiquitin-protein ligase RNF4-like n=1 Tax=Oopsacas minuta TaxID=111878 RepID=A0AAV7JKQ3_9METZ|nr:E3 ubiquitin-protein ligase RNF4-like [Oopsacas minuta]